MGFAWLSVTITKRFNSGVDVFLPGLLFLISAYYWWPDGTHHWFSSFCAIAAMAVVLERRSPVRLSAAGALCGLALCFTQLRGAAAALGISAFLCWEYRNKRQSWASLLKNQAYALGAFLATILAFNAYFAWKAGLRQFLWCTITFGIKYYPAFPANTWRVILLDFPEFHPWSHQLVRVGVFLFLHGLVPLVYVLFFVLYGRLKRSRPLEPWDQLMLVNWIGASLFIGIAPAPDDLRLSSISLPAFIVLVWLLRLWGTKGRPVLRAIWVAALVLVVIEPGSRQIHWRTEFALPIGRVAFLDRSSYEMHRWVLERISPPGFFFEEEFPRMNFTLNLRNPAPVPVLTNADYTRPEQVLAAVRALEERRVRFVMVSPWLDRKMMGRDWGDHLEPLRAYLGTHYHAVKTFANSEQVLERNE